MNANLTGAGFTGAAAPPGRILLATDLSARCDRALERAAQLAQQWSAELIALNVLDPAASPEQMLAWSGGADEAQLLGFARRQLSRDLAALSIPATLRTVRATDVGTAIAETAASSDAGLVVTGVARNETLGRFLLGSTVQCLARTLIQPLLVVRSRVYGPYRRIVVASDFSATSGAVLQSAARLFPGCELIIYHADEIGLAALADDPLPGRTGQAIAQRQCDDFLAATALPAGTAVQTVIAQGTLEIALTQYVREHDIDLVVAGTHGRSGVMSVLLGSTAAKLLDWLPCDALLVRATPD